MNDAAWLAFAGALGAALKVFLDFLLKLSGRRTRLELDHRKLRIEEGQLQKEIQRADLSSTGDLAEILGKVVNQLDQQTSTGLELRDRMERLERLVRYMRRQLERLGAGPEVMGEIDKRLAEL